MAGRPTKRTPTMEEKLCEALRNGNTRRAACQVAGISEDSLARYMDNADFAEASSPSVSNMLVEVTGMAKKRRTPDEAWAKGRMLENVQDSVPDKETLRIEALLMFLRDLEAKLDVMGPGDTLGIVFNIQVLKNERNVPQYAEWRLAVYERDKYTCQECGHRGQIVAHHIESWAKFPEKRFDLDNGITLCDPCHELKHPHIGAVRRSGARRNNGSSD